MINEELTIIVAKILSPQSWNALDTKCDTKAKKKRREASYDYAKRVLNAIDQYWEEKIVKQIEAEND